MYFCKSCYRDVSFYKLYLNFIQSYVEAYKCFNIAKYIGKMSQYKRQKLFRAMEILSSEEGAEPDHHRAYPPEREEFRISLVECEIIVEGEINKNIVESTDDGMIAKVVCDGDTQPQTPDKEFVKVVIDNGNETDDNAEVYNDEYNIDYFGYNGENGVYGETNVKEEKVGKIWDKVPAVELETG